MKARRFFAGVLILPALILVLLITAVEIAAYSDMSYYDREYERLNVPQTVDMEPEDLRYVTKEMMSYLRGDREDLTVVTRVAGVEREFFNEREKAHMADCRVLFVGGIMLRRVALVILLAGMCLLVWSKTRISSFLPRLIRRGILGMLAVVGILAALFAADFNRYFTIFHLIFFDNDLWILDPATDLLINIVPEPFWIRMGARVAIVFVILIGCVFALSIVWSMIDRKKSGAKRPACLGLVLLLAAGLLFAPQRVAASPVSQPEKLPSLTGLDIYPAPPEVSADYAILMDARTGTVLYEKNAYDKAYPASITKIMTGLLVMENCRMEDEVTFSYRATHELDIGSSSIARTEGEVMSVRDCLYGLMIASANEVAQAFAEHISGSFEAFGELMTARARELGALNTNFTSPSGLHKDNHYTTAYDMAVIMREAVKNDFYREVMGTETYQIPATNKHADSLYIRMRHPLVRKNAEYSYEGAIAGKTGYTDEARSTLVTYAERGDMHLICVVMHALGTPAMAKDSVALFDYGFGKFSTYQVGDSESVIKAVQKAGSFLDENMLTFANSGDAWLTIPSSLSPSDLSYTMSYGNSDSADIVATKIYTYQGQVVGSIPVSVVRSEPRFELKHKESVAAPIKERLETTLLGIPLLYWLIAGVILLVLLLAFVIMLLLAGSRSSRRRRAVRSRPSYGSMSAGRSRGRGRKIR